MCVKLSNIHISDVFADRCLLFVFMTQFFLNSGVIVNIPWVDKRKAIYFPIDTLLYVVFDV